MNFFRLQFIILFLVCSFGAFAQNTGTITGKIVDSTGEAVTGVKLKVKGENISTYTDGDGTFSLKVPTGKVTFLECLYLGHLQREIPVPPLGIDEVHNMHNITLNSHIKGDEVIVTDSTHKSNRYMEVLNPHYFDDIPNVTGGIEGILKTLAGVSSNNELSSQYSVRGGNFDENLVYINDIEVYRPQLVRSGQEEGLSIINTDMVQSLSFSSGGFEARYGDKLSSVLDIHYKDPDTFAARTNLSLLGASAEVEGTSKDHRLRYMVGVRYRSSKYILNSLDVQGDYQPTFLDAQGYLSYNLTDVLSVHYLTYLGYNQYLSVPQSQTTQFGTATSAVQFVVAFDGQQVLQYNTFLNGLTLDFHPNKKNVVKFITSFYNTTESENYDIIGAYKLQELNSDLGSAGFGNANYTFGLGEFLYHARNSFYSEIYNDEVKGYHTLSPTAELQWGAKFQHEHIEASLNEYHYIDSVDYSVPQSGDPRKELNVYSYLYSRNNRDWNRYSAYTQATFNLDPYYNEYLTAGVRANYWDFNHELLISPRAQFSFEPNAGYNRKLLVSGFDDSLLKSQFKLRASAGIYQQPPFFKELFDLNGNIVPDIKAQKSAHVVMGEDYNFKMWNRPFKWTTELYYKYLWDVIPYEIDNVHISYLGNNKATGYATGLDMQLNGELVKDVQSWVSLSILSTAENDSFTIINPTTHEPLHVYGRQIPRPSDQRVRFSLFFQDYLPNNPTYKVHLNLVFGSGLPFGPPTFNPAADTLRLPPYRRVDIGFSKQFWDKSKQHTNSKFLSAFKSIWFSVEVFNLLQINNTVAYLWVQDIDGSQWAVPSYLTSRRLNFHLELKF